MRKVVLVIFFVLSIVFISGCANSQYQTFNGKNMTFQYPSNYTAKNTTSIVVDTYEAATVKNGNNVVNIEASQKSLDKILEDLYFMGYNFKEEKNSAGATYKIYTNKGNTKLIYITQKNGKLFMIYSDPSQSYVMDKIVETIQ